MKSKEINIGDDSSGIQIKYVKSHKIIQISGHYNRYVGIKGKSFTLQEFCDALGIDLIQEGRRIEKAIQDEDKDYTSLEDGT